MCAAKPKPVLLELVQLYPALHTYTALMDALQQRHTKNIMIATHHSKIELLCQGEMRHTEKKKQRYQKLTKVVKFARFTATLHKHRKKIKQHNKQTG